MKRIYLDYAATAPLTEQAKQAMLPWLDAGNPSSLYEEGRRAKDALDQARETLSEALGCLFAEVIFTSGGTESANLAVLGAALANEDPSRKRILLSAAEHHCVLHLEPALARLGYRVDLLSVEREGFVGVDTVAKALDSDVFMVCLMQANNELGSITPVEDMASLVKGAGALFFVDAVQSFGYGLARGLSADLVSVSSHKIGGPKGAGALRVRAGTRLKALIAGGGQERELRGGTENVAAIVGFAAAVSTTSLSSGPRDLFERRLIEAGAVPSVVDSPRLPGHCHVRFPGVGAETALIRLDREGIAASSGAACSSGSVEPSHVMLACGYSLEAAREALRFTFGPGVTEALAAEAAERVVRVMHSLRK